MHDELFYWGLGQNHDYNQNNHYFSRVFFPRKAPMEPNFFRVDFTLHLMTSFFLMLIKY